MDTIKKTASLLMSDNVKEYDFIPKATKSLPNVDMIKEIVLLLKSILFPGFFGDEKNIEDSHKLELDINAYIEKLYLLLNEQICRSFVFFDGTVADIKGISEKTTIAFIDKLPKIKRLLATDVKAVYDNDPAAKSYGEVIFCYPAIQAMIHYRVAHELLLMNVPVLPRIITELAHSATGIDIHPGAQIGEYFSIDHGTGIVIGETCIIGNNVKLYQGVTLGAKSFTLDHDGLPVNEQRHPILEDNVIIYSNATILGRITIGHDSIVGGNIWQVYSVPPFSRVVQKKATTAFTDGLGI
ncbi:MAG: serine acetyltransferase [Prevotellaceae bacterium]|jgi:serine O-acetyltransferase|nr:serine acetyltransferase [Prevotellaceae bacterium]